MIKNERLKENLLSFFANHFVSMGWTNKTHEERESASGFIVSIIDEWFWVTAGHVLKHIVDCKESGHLLNEWYLDDCAGAGAKFKVSIPFDYDGAYKWYDCDDTSGKDYGLIYLRPHYRSLLEKNNVIPLNEEAWKKNFKGEFEFYLILGTPYELMQHSILTRVIRKYYVLLPVERVTKPPLPMRKSHIRFYGKIPTTNEFQSIEGMSGAPIFGFKHIGAELHYWIVAIQSSWLRSERIVAGCYIDSLFAWIEMEARGIILNQLGSDK